jgi:hypothetical protein
MAEAATIAPHSPARWTDKPLARLMLAALGLAAMSAVSGATWLVKSGVDGKVAEARNEERFKSIDRNLEGLGRDMREVKEDVKDISRRVPK